MTGVVFVFVREDASEAETLANAFESAGFRLTSDDIDAEAIAIIVWSRHAVRSGAFREATERALYERMAIIASLNAAPADAVLGAPIIDLSAWNGEENASLAPLFEAANDLIRPPRANVIELPARPAYEDAEFVEVGPQSPNLDIERDRRLRLAWEAPISAQTVPATPDDPPTPKLGAAEPRRDFRRVGERRDTPGAFAAIALAAILLVGGGVIALEHSAPTEAPIARASQIVAEDVIIDAAPVSLTLASEEADGLEDAAPVESPAQIGRAGLEPPSARNIHRVTARSARDEVNAYRPPALIPEAVAMDLQRGERG